MARCYYCDEKIGDLSYKCKYCGMTFCRIHRIPENHDCPFDLKQKPFSETDSKIALLLYQDALDFMNKEFTVAKIYDYVTTKKLNKLEAVNLLRYFLETSQDIEVRINCIIAFKLLNLNNHEAYTVLESCVLSDENLTVRDTAIEVLKFRFPKKSAELIKWINDQNNII